MAAAALLCKLPVVWQAAQHEPHPVFWCHQLLAAKLLSWLPAVWQQEPHSVFWGAASPLAQPRKLRMPPAYMRPAAA